MSESPDFTWDITGPPYASKAEALAQVDVLEETYFK